MRGWGVGLLGLALLCRVWPVSPAWAEYRHRGKRDPLVPLILPDGRRITPPSTEDPALQSKGPAASALQGIVYDAGGDSYAILEGHVVRRGEEYGGMKILKIEPTTVTVREDGGTRVLTVRPEAEEKTAE